MSKYKNVNILVICKTVEMCNAIVEMYCELHELNIELFIDWKAWFLATKLYSWISL